MPERLKVNRFRARALFTFTLCPLFLLSCLDFQQTEEQFRNYSPMIDKSHVRPEPLELLSKPISIGENCKFEFIVPPINDPNVKDELYFLWFLKSPGQTYGKLLKPGAGIIKAKNRDSAVISLLLDKQLVQSIQNQELTPNFFAQTHLIEFYVSDRKYIIPHTRYNAPNAKEDYFYWAVRFIDQEC